MTLTNLPTVGGTRRKSRILKERGGSLVQIGGMVGESDGRPLEVDWLSRPHPTAGVSTVLS